MRLSLTKDLEARRAAFPSLTPRQLRLALAHIEITEAEIDAKLDNNQFAAIEWKWATEYKRLHPLVVTLGPMFDLTPEQIDIVWLWAATL
jgi:hypothetical protein